MRVLTLIGSIFLFLLVITAVEGDKRKNDIDLKEKLNNNIKAKHNVKDDDDDSDEEQPVRKNKKRIKNNNDDDESSEESVPYKNGKKIADEKPKKFVGRIERGKVKVLRTPNNKNDDSAEEEADKDTKTCHKKGKNACIEESDDTDEESSEEAEVEHKKIKYSIKFQHEKQKKREKKPDMSVMRLHKNGKKYGRHDDDSSEEEEEPLKRFHYVDDDD